MDLAQLITFERIVREGSFSKAAFALGISQPTVSARVQMLEQHLGSPLFQRGRRVSLTEQGERFLPFARRAIASLQDGRDAAQLSASGVQGRLQVGILHSLASALVGPAMRHFAEAHPDVECVLPDGKHWDILEFLYDGVIELGFVCWPCLEPLLADLTPVLHLREPVHLFTSPEHPLTQLGRVQTEDVIAHSKPLILLRWWQVTPRHLARLCSRAGAADLCSASALHLVKYGQGAGFFNQMVVQEELEAGTISRVPVADLPPTYRDTALVHLSRRKQLSTAAQTFITYVSHIAEQHGVLVDATS
ncbi:MAG: LysR family transcriptional regulator [Deinococcota bacterium]